MCIWERFTLWSHHSPIHNGFCRVCKQDTLLVCIHLQVFAESKSLIHCHLHLSDVKRFCLDSHRKRFRHLISFPFPLLKKTFFFSTRPLIPHRHQSDWFCVYHSFILKTRDFSSHSFCSCVIYLTNSFLLHEKWLYWALTKKKKKLQKQYLDTWYCQDCILSLNINWREFEMWFLNLQTGTIKKSQRDVCHITTGRLSSAYICCSQPCTTVFGLCFYECVCVCISSLSLSSPLYSLLIIKAS